MDKNVALAFLYTDLGYVASNVPPNVADYAGLCLDSAASRLEADGIPNPTVSPAVSMLWVSFAAYLYRSRNTEKPMPQSLRLALNDAKIAAATKEAKA